MELWLSVRNHASAARDVVVQIDPSHAVADLAVALLRHLDPDAATDPPPAVRCGQETLDPAATVAESGLQRGDDLTIGGPPQDDAVTGAWLLRAVGGPCTGRVWPMPIGTWTLGRDDGVDLRLDDAFASRRHLQFDVAASGVEVTDLGSANGTIIEGEGIKGRRPLAAGEVIEVGSSQLEVVHPSTEGQQPSAGEHDPLLASVDAPLTSLPIVRRSMRRTSVDLGEARRQLDARSPGVGRLADRVATRSARRDRVLRVGFGTLLAVHEGDQLAVPSAPLTVDLDEVAEVVCAGPDPDGLARSLVLQLAVAHEPQELSIAVAGGRARASHWSWAAWLPHTRAGRPGAPNAADLLAFEVGEAATLVRAITELTRLRRVQDERHVLVLDASLPFGDGDLPTQEALRRAGILVLWVGTPPHRGEVHIVPSGEDGSVTIVGPGDRDVHGDGADHVDAATARALALAIARRDHHAGETLPPTVGIQATVGTIDAATLQGTWAEARSLRWVIGVGAKGPVHVELGPVSPHLMVAGDHRSGGSTVLRTSIAGLAANLPPTELGLVLVGHDVRAFGPLTDLPHVVAVVTEHGSTALSRALVEELESRRALVERMSARSLPALREAGASVPPRLVVVVDGLDGESANGLADAIVHGPAMDVHVIASLTGTESRGSLAGVANRIQLRTTDPGVSLDVLGTTQGLSLPVDRAGRAWIRLADGAPEPIQIASAAVPRRGRDEITVTDLAAGRPSTIGGHTAVARTLDSDQDVLAELVQAAVAAAASVGGSDWSGWLDGHVPDARARKTFMFTDIVGSTDLVRAIGDEAWTRLLAWHDETLRRCFEDHGGLEVGNAGDGFLVAFADPASATACAIDIQRQLDHHRNAAGFAPQVRIGVHEAEAQHNGERFTGHGVHVAARVGGVGGPSEIVASLETARLAGATTSHPRSVEAKGVPEPLEIVTVQWRT